MTAPTPATPVASGAPVASTTSARVRPLARPLSAVALGALLGLAAWSADQLAYPWSVLIPANTVAVWVAVAFAAGALGVSIVGGAIRGLTALLAAVVVYEALTGTLGYGVSSGGAVHASLVWGATATVIGPVFGSAGATWRGSRGRARAIAVAVLGAAFIAEGLVFGAPRLVVVDELVHDPGAIVLGLEMAIGLAIPWLLLRPGERRTGYVALAVLGAIAALAIEPATVVLRSIADRF